MAEDTQKVEIGFEGGQVVAGAAHRGGAEGASRKQVEKGGWHDLETEDGVLAVDLGKVAFLRDRLRRAPGRLRRSAD